MTRRMITLVFALCSSSIATLCGAATVQGTVATPDGKPAGGAPVWLCTWDGVAVATKTDSAGRFQLQTVDNCYAVAAWPKGGAIAWATVDPHVGGTFPLRSARPVAVHGKVVGPDGGPVAGALVSPAVLVDPDWYLPMFRRRRPLAAAGALPGATVRSGRDGSFTLSGIPEDACAAITAQAPHLAAVPGSPRAFRSFQAPRVSKVGEATLVQPGEDSVTLHMAPMASISGYVTFEGQPRPGAIVTIMNGMTPRDTLTAVADRAGHYSFEVAPGSYAPGASTADGLVSDVVWCTVESGDAARLDFELGRTVIARGAIALNGISPKEWTARINPLELYDLNASFGGFSLHQVGKRGVTVPIDASGRFSGRVPLGSWRFTASSRAGWASGDFTVSPEQLGKEMEVKSAFRAKPDGITIRVRDGQGNPVPGAPIAGEETDSRGEYRPAGDRRDYALYAASVDLTQFCEGSFPKGSDVLTLTLVPGEPVSGRVMDDRGHGIDHASCQAEVRCAGPGPNPRPYEALWFSVPTGPDGEYRFNLPAKSTFRLTYVKNGLQAVQTGESVLAEGGSRMPDVRLEPNDRSTDGVVCDKQGHPLAGAPVMASWQWHESTGPQESRLVWTDENGAFKIEGLPRKVGVSIAVAWTPEFRSAQPWSRLTELHRLKLVGLRRPRTGPISFTAGTPLLSSSDVDWIQGPPPTIGTADYSLLFVTAHNGSCESQCRWANSSRVFPTRDPTIVVFDSALPLEQTKQYVAALHISGPVARVKDGPDLGWGGDGLFKRFAVRSVPGWGALDRAGNPRVPEDLDYGSDSRPPQSPFRLNYRVRTDGSPAKAAEAGPTDLRVPLPASVTNARFYAIGSGAFLRPLAVGESAGRKVVVFDADALGDPSGAEVVPLAQHGEEWSAVIAIAGAYQTGPAFGHYEVGVNAPGTADEKVRLTALGSMVGDVIVGGRTFDCTLIDSDSELSFPGGARFVWRSGDTVVEVPTQGLFIEEGRSYRISVDHWGAEVTVQPTTELAGYTYDADSASLQGNGWDSRWTVQGSGGKLYLPKAANYWSGTFTRKGSDGQPWTAWTIYMGNGLQPGTKIELDRLSCTLTAKRKADEVSLELNIAAPSGLRLCSVTRPSGVLAPIEADLLDSTGKVLESWAMTADPNSVFTAHQARPKGAVRARVKLDLGPFSAVPAEVLLDAVDESRAQSTLVLDGGFASELGARSSPRAPQGGMARAAAGPFAAEGPPFESGEVDWIQGSPPKTASAEASVLFATAYDPACEEAARSLEATASPPAVVVYDAGLPLDELKAYVAKLGIAVPVGRVKDGPDLGWGGDGFFKRFRVPCVPSVGVVDREGRPHPAKPVHNFAAGGSGSSPLMYRAPKDPSLEGCGEQGQLSPLKGRSLAGIDDARFYNFWYGSVKRWVAVGTRDGVPVVAVDTRGLGDQADMVFRPLPQPPGRFARVVVPFRGFERRPGPDGDVDAPAFLGYYDVDVTNAFTKDEQVRVGPVGSKVGRLVLAGTVWDCTVTNSGVHLGFDPFDGVELKHGSEVRSFKLGESMIVGDKMLQVSVDPMGTHVRAVQLPELREFAYDDEAVTVSGEAYGEACTALGSEGHIALPKVVSSWRVTFARTAADGTRRQAAFIQRGSELPANLRLESSPLQPELDVRVEGDFATIEASFVSPSGLQLESMFSKGTDRGSVTAELLDSSGAVVDSWALSHNAVERWPGGVGVWSVCRRLPPLAVTARLKVDFGPFKVNPAQVALRK